MEQNPDTKNWLCHIHSTPQAYYYERKKDAEKFCNKVNEAFEKGELYFDEDGNVKKEFKQ